MADCTSTLQTQVQAAYLAGKPITIQGAQSKFATDKYEQCIDVTQHTGIVEYDPSELVVVVRAGTPLKELIAVLSDQGQILGFDSPFASRGATVGGMVAAGFSGSARPFRGTVRDYILGAKIINGKGEVLQFGGKVMKNVAGFDLFRPMAGAMGTLGVLLEVSLRLIPKPLAQKAVSLTSVDMDKVIARFTELSNSAATLSGAHWVDSQMLLRFSGTHEAVNFDMDKVPDAEKATEKQFVEVDERSHAFFENDKAIYKCSLPSASRALKLRADQLIDWAGAQRFVKLKGSSEVDLYNEVESLGGRVIQLQQNGLVSPLLNVPSELHSIHQQIKASFDPAGILNSQWSVGC